LHSSPNYTRVIKSRRMRWARYVAHIGEMRKPKGKRLLVRTRRRWEDNIKMYLRESDLRCGLRLSGSGYGPVVGSCEHSKEPWGPVKGGEFLD
jgi:hypothetical protein